MYSKEVNLFSDSNCPSLPKAIKSSVVIYYRFRGFRELMTKNGLENMEPTPLNEKSCKQT